MKKLRIKKHQDFQKIEKMSVWPTEKQSKYYNSLTQVIFPSFKYLWDAGYAKNTFIFNFLQKSVIAPRDLAGYSASMCQLNHRMAVLTTSKGKVNIFWTRNSVIQNSVDFFIGIVSIENDLENFTRNISEKVMKHRSAKIS